MNLLLRTRLDVINYVIGCLGLAPVAAEDTYNLDVAQAVTAMDTYSSTIQDNSGRGMWFNREHIRNLSPDPVNGYISLPNNALATWVYDDYGNFKRMATRGGYLYDTFRYGMDMRQHVDGDGFLRAVIVTQLEIEDIPATVRFAIATKAGYRFAAQNEVEQTRLRVLATEAENAMWAVEAENTAQENSNAFTSNATLSAFIRNNQPYTLNSWQGSPF